MIFQLLFPFVFKNNRGKVHPRTPPEETARLCETLMNACDVVLVYHGSIVLHAYHIDQHMTHKDAVSKPKIKVEIKSQEWPSFEHQEKILALAAHPFYWKRITATLLPFDPKDYSAMQKAFLKEIGTYGLVSSTPYIQVLSTTAQQTDTIAITKVTG